jgi:hypothetical protein
MFEQLPSTAKPLKHATLCRSKQIILNVLLFWILLCSALTTSGHAQAEPYYQGKTIRIIVGFTAGGLS